MYQSGQCSRSHYVRSHSVEQYIIRHISGCQSSQLGAKCHQVNNVICQMDRISNTGLYILAFCLNTLRRRESGRERQTERQTERVCERVSEWVSEWVENLLHIVPHWLSILQVAIHITNHVWKLWIHHSIYLDHHLHTNELHKMSNSWFIVLYVFSQTLFVHPSFHTNIHYYHQSVYCNSSFQVPWRRSCSRHFGMSADALGFQFWPFLYRWCILSTHAMDSDWSHFLWQYYSYMNISFV